MSNPFSTSSEDLIVQLYRAELKDLTTGGYASTISESQLNEIISKMEDGTVRDQGHDYRIRAFVYNSNVNNDEGQVRARGRDVKLTPEEFERLGRPKELEARIKTQVFYHIPEQQS